MIRYKLKEDSMFDWSPFNSSASICTSIHTNPPKDLESNVIEVFLAYNLIPDLYLNLWGMATLYDILNSIKLAYIYRNSSSF